MQRYARELATALHRVCGERWQLQEFLKPRARIGSRFITGSQGERVDSALGRYFQYPLQASRVSGDLFHVLDHGYAQVVLGLNRRKTVVTCHDLIPLVAGAGLIPLDIPPSVVKTVKFRLSCMARAAYVIAISESTKRDIIKFTKIPPERIILVPYGVSAAFMQKEEPGSVRAIHHNFGIPAGTKVILQIGTSGRYKNTPALLKALHVLRTSVPLKIKLLRIGAPFAAEEQNLINEFGLDDHIVHAGRVDGDERLAGFYRAADLLAFPSMWEGFGWPPLEAMACGTPVVASNAASLPEVIGDAGLLVEPQDSEGLARAMQRLLTNDELRRSLIEKGLQRARCFTWERTALDTLAVYERVIREQEDNHDPTD